MQRSQLSLKWLEVFQMVAQRGSVQDVAAEAGLSISTVSHHLRSLEEQLGVSLVDHSKRPMVLTTAGETFLRHIEQAMRHIRMAEQELVSGDLSTVQSLSLVLIEEFDSDIAPELASILASRMQNTKLGLYSRPSHRVFPLLRKRQLSAAICARPLEAVPDLIEYPLLRDPYIVAMPEATDYTAQDCLAGATSLPLLRYSRDQFIGRQIEAQLARLRIKLPNRFECDSTLSILGLVAEGRGWAITTPSNVPRVRRLRSQVRFERFPQQGFARFLSLFTTDEFSEDLARTIAETMRRLIELRMVAPALEQMPWLDESFYLIADSGLTIESETVI
ncbi:MAG: LysR family transcriptional regulator [Pseudomonadota bacterium]